jgi:hypothetical protein
MNLFSAATLNSVWVIKDVLVEFESLSGLRANPAKSNIFFVLESLMLTRGSW